MGLINPPQVSTNDSVVPAAVNDPINTIADEFNGNIENANIKANAGIATSKIAADGGLTRASLQYGLVRQRQGSTTGDASWATAGNNNTDTSAKSAFIQVGAKTLTAQTTSVSFPTAFTQAPIVTATPFGSGGIFEGFYINNISTTGFDFISESYTQTAACYWIAVGQ